VSEEIKLSIYFSLLLAGSANKNRKTYSQYQSAARFETRIPLKKGSVSIHQFPSLSTLILMTRLHQRFCGFAGGNTAWNGGMLLL
jgi:hypothetical protein